MIRPLRMRHSPELASHCHQVMKKGSLSFSLAARLFPKSLRESASLLYLWCRHCDDVIDGACSGPDALEALERETRAACEWDGQSPLDPAFQGLGHVARSFAIPPQFPLDFLEGMKSDLHHKPYATLNELRRYCYCVAGTVGLMMTYTMGASSARALPHAVEMGIAMQLTNIARDILEDLERERVYLPAEWLSAEGIDALTLRPEHLQIIDIRVKVFKVAERLLEAADESYETARRGLNYLPIQGLFAVAAASSIYQEIAKQLRKEGPNALLKRTIVPFPRKLICLMRGLASCMPIVISRATIRWKRIPLPANWEGDPLPPNGCPFSRALAPLPDGNLGLEALKLLIREKSVLPVLELLRDRLGRIFLVRFPRFRSTIVSGPECCRHVLVDNASSFLWRCATDPLAKLLPGGMLVQDGEEHDKLRSIMSPVFSSSRVMRNIPTMIDCAERASSNWSDGSIIDAHRELKKISLLITTETLFGVRLTPEEVLALSGPIEKAVKFISPGLWLAFPNAPRFGFRRPLRSLSGFLQRLIEARKIQPNPGDDLLGTLLSAGLDDQVIRDQLMMMLIAGHDTTTSLMNWALYLLCSHPESMVKARTEARQTDLRLHGLQPLHYLDCVIKESLRLYPPVHVGSRRAADNTAIEGYTVPRGSRLLYSIYLTHRDPAHWQEPSRFVPERFERGATRAAFTYIPFGGGKRNCIGAAFGVTEAKVVLASLLRKFDLELVSGEAKVKMGATLELRPRLKIKITRRIQA